MIKYLFYTESASTGGSLSTASAVSLLDQLVYLFGGELMAIHPAGADYSSQISETYETLSAAQAAYPTHTWIYFDPNGTEYLENLIHPADDVVYVVGHDSSGFGTEDPTGVKYKIRTLQEEPYETFASVCLSMAIIDRWGRT